MKMHKDKGVVLEDERVLKLLKRADSYELEYRLSIQDLDDPYFQGMTDVEFVKEETDYLIGMYEEGGTVFSDDLAEARHILSKTRYGKIQFIDMETFKPVKRYNSRAVEWAKGVVNELNRLKTLSKKLASLSA